MSLPACLCVHMRLVARLWLRPRCDARCVDPWREFDPDELVAVVLAALAVFVAFRLLFGF
jgi:hypothetical protein